MRNLSLSKECKVCKLKFKDNFSLELHNNNCHKLDIIWNVKHTSENFTFTRKSNQGSVQSTT